MNIWLKLRAKPQTVRRPNQGLGDFQAGKMEPNSTSGSCALRFVRSAIGFARVGRKSRGAPSTIWGESTMPAACNPCHCHAVASDQCEAALWCIGYAPRDQCLHKCSGLSYSHPHTSEHTDAIHYCAAAQGFDKDLNATLWNPCGVNVGQACCSITQPRPSLPQCAWHGICCAADHSITHL